MALEMRTACERCHATLTHVSEAFICSYECTFCPKCTASMDATCPNCGGELAKRPARRPDGPDREPEDTSVRYISGN